MIRFMKIKSINPKTEQKEIAREIESSSILQRYGRDKKFQVVINQTIPNDLQRLQMTSKDLQLSQKTQMKMIKLFLKK